MSTITKIQEFQRNVQQLRVAAYCQSQLTILLSSKVWKINVNITKNIFDVTLTGS
ncbi:MAG: hypothetical protein ACLSH6_10450 [Limosilactobacillus pontis]